VKIYNEKEKIIFEANKEQKLADIFNIIGRIHQKRFGT